MSVPRRIGIIAGGGSLPREIADSIAARGLPLHIVAMAGEATADFGPYPLTRVEWGQIGRMVETLRQTDCSDLVIIGGVKRPDLGALRPDLGFFRALASVLRIVVAGGDDAVLRGVVRFFEGAGFRVLSPARVAPELVIGDGVFAGHALSDEARRDAEVGMAAIAALSAYDIGQAVVVNGGQVEAFEGAEGTARLLARVGDFRRRRGIRPEYPQGVLVKSAKVTQDDRVDLPVIGPETVTQCIEAGIADVAVEAGRVLAAARFELAARAEAGRINIVGILPAEGAGARTAPGLARARAPSPLRRAIGGVFGNKVPHGVMQLGRRHVPSGAVSDIELGQRLIADLSSFTECRAVVIVRGHVLAVDCGEGVEAVIARAGGLRQWGDRRLRQRMGVVVLAAGRYCAAHVVGAAVDAGLAGVAAGLRRFAAGVGPESIAAADAKGLFIAGYALDGEEKQ